MSEVSNVMIEEFIKSSLWKKMEEELNSWISDLVEIQDSSNDEKELYRCQGRKEAIKNMLNLPNVLLDRCING